MPSVVLLLGVTTLLGACSATAGSPTAREIGDDGAGGAREAGAADVHTSTGGCPLPHSGLNLSVYCPGNSVMCQPLGELDCAAGPGDHPGAVVVRGCGFAKFTIEDDAGNTWVYGYDERTGRLIFYRWDGTDCQFNVAIDVAVDFGCSTWTPSTCAAVQGVPANAG